MFFFFWFEVLEIEDIFFFFVLVNGGGNEATQLLRQMINCRSLGLPIPASLSISNARSVDQPMSLIKVSVKKMFLLFSRSSKGIYFPKQWTHDKSSIYEGEITPENIGTRL